MDNLLSDLSKHILGDLTLADYISGMFFALIGALISLRISARKRDVESPSTPRKFNFLFLIRDNLMRLLNGFCITYIVFRFMPLLLNMQFSIGTAFLVGFCFDNVILIIQNYQNKARESFGKK